MNNAQVIGKPTQLYPFPSTAYPAEILSVGTELEMGPTIKVDGQWFTVLLSGGRKGYLRSLDNVFLWKQATLLQQSVNVHLAASQNSEVILELQQDAEFAMTGIFDDTDGGEAWVQIRSKDGIVGFIPGTTAVNTTSKKAGKNKSNASLSTHIQKIRSDGKIMLPILIYSWYLSFRGVICIGVSAAVWGNPTSSFSNFIYKHCGFVINMIPSFLMPLQFAAYSSANAYKTILPIAFFGVGVISFVLVGMIAARFWLVRWAVMFISGATALRTLPYLFMHTVSKGGTELTAGQMSSMFLSVSINLMIFFYLAFDPQVAKEFEDTL